MGAGCYQLLIFIIFAFSFFKPNSARDWRTFGAFSAFVVALFAEMYGSPLTIYLLAGWLQTKFPQTNLFTHDSGHIWWTMTGQHGNPHLGFPHLASIALIFGGFYLLSTAWHVLYEAQRNGQLATTGPYARIRHPQYVAFIIIMTGFLLQWPTLVTSSCSRFLSACTCTSPGRRSVIQKSNLDRRGVNMQHAHRALFHGYLGEIPHMSNEASRKWACTVYKHDTRPVIGDARCVKSSPCANAARWR